MRCRTQGAVACFARIRQRPFVKALGARRRLKTQQKPILAFVFAEKGLIGDLSLEGSKISKIEDQVGCPFPALRCGRRRRAASDRELGYSDPPFGSDPSPSICSDHQVR